MGLILQPCRKLCCSTIGFFFFFDFEYAINVKNRPYFSVPNGMTMVNVTFPARESLRSKLVS
jgi:hypothetical protein